MWISRWRALRACCWSANPARQMGCTRELSPTVCLGLVSALPLPSGLRLPNHLPCLSKSGRWAILGHVCLCLPPRVEPTEAGDYKLCFDNSFSTISEKLVFFELIFDSLQDDEEVEGWAEAVEPEEMLDVKMEDIKVRPG